MARPDPAVFGLTALELFCGISGFAAAVAGSNVGGGRFGAGFRILAPSDPDAYTTCFTAGYGG